MVSGKSAVVIGGGIAGASTAYFLSHAGFHVTVIDAAQHTASHVPAALINPVRGQSGQVDARAIAGMHFTWALIRELTVQGHTIPHAQNGVLRPIPDDKTRTKFERNLPAELEHHWLRPSESPTPLTPGWAQVLWLPQGGWVDGQAFCQALLAASGAEVIRGQVLSWTAQSLQILPTDHSALTTDHAASVIHCGGSIGSTWAGETATHRMGSMLLLDRAASDIPLSFGAYLSPAAVGGVLGGTFETPAQTWQPPHLPLHSLHWLLGKGAALTDLGGTKVTGRWTGSRLSGLQVGQQPNGVWRLTGLSSKGFLLGPLLAQELAKQVAQARP